MEEILQRFLRRHLGKMARFALRLFEAMVQDFYKNTAKAQSKRLKLDRQTDIEWAIHRLYPGKNKAE